MIGITPEKLQEMYDRGESLIALIEGGFPLYFGERIGMELLGLIAEADARRDARAEYTVVEVVTRRNPLDF